MPSGSLDPVAFLLVAHAIRDKVARVGGSMRQPTEELFRSFGSTPSRAEQNEIERALGSAGVGVEPVDPEGRTVRRRCPAHPEPEAA